MRVFQNRVLRRMVGPKREEVTGEWRKLHKQEFYDLYCSPNIFRVIKSIIMGLAGHVARVRERRRAYGALVVKPEGRDHLEDTGVDGRIILRWICRKWIRGTEGIDVAQDRDRWREIVDAVMNLRVP